MSFRGKTIHGDVCPPLSSPRLFQQPEGNAKLRKPQSFNLIPDPFINSSVIIQRHRRTEVGKHLYRYFTPTPLPKEGPATAG